MVPSSTVRSARVDGPIRPAPDKGSHVVRPLDAGQSLLEDVACEIGRDVQGCFENLTLRRIDETFVEAALSDLLGHGLCGDDEHLVGDPLRFRREDRHSHRGGR
jgi:hypothetical protein